MAPKESGSAAVNDEADCCAGNASSYSRDAGKIQSRSAGTTYQRVTGEVGPIHLLGGPRVVVERHATRAFVWVENPIWGWPDARREFLRPDSPAVVKYALALASRIKDAALAEQHRQARMQDARQREVDSFRAEREACR